MFTAERERERERETDRQTEIRGKKDIIIANIYIYMLLYRYIILMCCIGI